MVRQELELREQRRPGSPETHDMEDADVRLEGEVHSEFCTGSRIVQFYAGDRTVSKSNGKEITREAANSTLRAQANLERASRYLVCHRRLLIVFVSLKKEN